MVSLGTELSLAFWIASARVGLPSTLLPPVRAATSMARISLANSLPRRASVAAFWCLMVAHLEWPDMLAPFGFRARPGLPARQVADQLGELAVEALLPGELRVEGRPEQVALAHGDHAPVHLGQHLDPRGQLSDPGGADEQGRDGPAVHPLEVELRLERGHL